MDLDQRLDVTLQAGSPRPPSLPTSEAWKSLASQTLWEAGHRGDGTHDHPLIGYAFGVVTQVAGVYTLLAGSVNVVSVTKQGTGWLRIVLTLTMASPALWMPCCYLINRTTTLCIYEARDVAAVTKSTTTVDIKICSAGGTLQDADFGFVVHGQRGT